ncbi:MAG: helix-turn-helix transcriptional regulator [Thermaceae bacterium]|nr:helix-turn-helix transcriptional regulator [Thermaceae bacterium]
MPHLEPDPLCPREREILRWVALGKTNLEIVERLNLRAKTVENYVNAVVDKLELKTRTQCTAPLD